MSCPCAIVMWRGSMKTASKDVVLSHVTGSDSRILVMQGPYLENDLMGAKSGGGETHGGQECKICLQIRWFELVIVFNSLGVSSANIPPQNGVGLRTRRCGYYWYKLKIVSPYFGSYTYSNWTLYVATKAKYCHTRCLSIVAFLARITSHAEKKHIKYIRLPKILTSPGEQDHRRLWLSQNVWFYWLAYDF